jgi:hypothetical protein
MRFSPSPRASSGLGSRARNASEIGLSSSENNPIAPGQNRSSSARNWLANATRAPTRSSRARVSALIALV